MSTTARFVSSGKWGAAVSRCSLKTRKNSLPGWYSHRSLTLALAACVDELYCTSALVNIHGVMV
ncbi:MAG: hypothetical protein AB7N65_25360 [Vicinamibacterales bacterium]